MCGIVAVLSRPDTRPLPDLKAGAARLGEAAERIRAWGTDGGPADAALAEAVAAAEKVSGDAAGARGMQALLSGPSGLAQEVRRLGEAVARFEQLLDQQASGLGTARVEALNALLVRAKDAQFGLERDRLGNVEKVRALMGGGNGEARLRAAYDINAALNSLDRLEVRGRDSAGVHVFVRGDFADLPDEVEEQIRSK